MPARQIRRPPGLALPQRPDDLLFREPCSVHLSALQEGRTLNPPGGKSQWQVSLPPVHRAGLEGQQRVEGGQSTVDFDNLPHNKGYYHTVYAGPFGRGGSGDDARRALQQSPISQVLASQVQSA